MMSRMNKKKKGIPFEARQIAPVNPMTAAPKKIEGEWRFPLNVPIPDDMMYCPVCHKKAERIPGKKGPMGETVFRCLNSSECKVKEFMRKIKYPAWCDKHNAWVKGPQCKRCHEFILHAEEWKSNDMACPHFHELTEDAKKKLAEEGFEEL